MNYSLCQLYSLPDPPTTGEACALYGGENHTAILQKCCGNGPIGNYSSDGLPTYCFQYCNITDPAITSRAALQCMTDELRKSSGSPTYDCGPGRSANATSNRSGAPGVRNRTLGWVVLAVAVASAVVGVDMVP